MKGYTYSKHTRNDLTKINPHLTPCPYKSHLLARMAPSQATQSMANLKSIMPRGKTHLKMQTLGWLGI